MSALPNSSIGIHLLFSCAQEDKALQKELEKHLSILQRGGFIAGWGEYQIAPEEAGQDEVASQNQTKPIILLLVSASFMASDRCYGEMEQALRQHDEKSAHVIPILLRPLSSSWRDAPFGRLNVLPRNGRPVTNWKRRDLAFVDIVDGIKLVVEKLQSEQSPGRLLSRRDLIERPSPPHPGAIRLRKDTVRDLYAILTQPDTTALVLTGIAGAGKSTLGDLVYHYTESQRRANKGPFTAETLKLRIDSAVTMVDLVGTLMGALDEPLPSAVQITAQDLIALLFRVLNQVSKPRLIILDQFEYLLGAEKGKSLEPNAPAEVLEWLRLLNSYACRCRILITSNVWPEEAHFGDSFYMKKYYTDGLEIKEGIELLRSWGMSVPASELQTLVEAFGGHALALTLAASISYSHKQKQANAMHEHDAFQIEEIAHFIEQIYADQLDTVQRALLFAFAIYREPVPLSAAQALLDQPVAEPVTQVQAALKELLARHLLQENDHRYHLHALVANYVRDTFITEGQAENDVVVRMSHERAAAYYQQQRKRDNSPLKQWRDMGDVHDVIEAIWHLCKAERWQEAYVVTVQENIFSDLLRWGKARTLLELYSLMPLDNQQMDALQIARIHRELGEAYSRLGQKQEALSYFEKALKQFQAIDESKGEALTCIHLGEAYNALGQKEQALACYERVLHICDEHEDLAIEELKGIALNDLGKIYHESRQETLALRHYEQALHFHREVSEEATTLNNLGGLYEQMGKVDHAYRYYQKSLHFFQEVNDRRGEGTVLQNLGRYWKMQQKLQEAREAYEQAWQLFREIGDRWSESVTLQNLSQLYLAQNHYRKALACVFLARKILQELQNPQQDEMKGIVALIRHHFGKAAFETIWSEFAANAQSLPEQILHDESA